MYKFLILLACIATVFAGAPSSTKVTASIKDTTVNGVEGLNVNIAAPFKFQEYVVGFKYALGDLRRAPESLFAKRSFDTIANGKVTVDTDYNLADSVLSVATKWCSDTLGLSIGADANSKNRVTNVDVSKSLDVKDNKLNVNAAYDILKKKFSSSASYNVESTTVDVKYDNVDKDPVLSVTRSIDSKNEISPSISLKNGDVAYGYTRKWEGGALKSKLFPGDKVSLEWTDNGANGAWTTSAEVPLADRSNTKISFSRDWNY